ncbi:MAG: DUF4430 domain-containing protein [Oscillospiraceae bacterium]|nr:DUF4430 domain-containing protein [Oscillospiraceae bacterium]
MDRFVKLLKTGQANIAMAACAAAAVLAAVFFLQPGPGKNEVTAAAAEPAQEETALFSQQAQGIAPSIDVDAILRQAQARPTGVVPPTQLPAASPTLLPPVVQTQPGSPSTAQAIATAAWAQATQASTAAQAATAYTTSTAPSTASTKAATTSAPTTVPAATAQPTTAQLACTVSIRCDTVLVKENMDKLSQAKQTIVPGSGVILQGRTVGFTEGESVFDVLKRVTQSEKIHMDFDSNPMYNSAYIAAIGNLYEKDAGDLSGWMYRVNGVFPGYGCGKYALKQGDVVEWLYTCDLGRDVGGWGVTQR